MNSKKMLIGTLIVLFLFLSSFPVAPIGPACPKGSPSVCGLVSNLVLVVGGSVVLISELKHKIMPDINVLVELDTGEVKPGILSSKAASGRPVKAGDRVRLNCSKPSSREGSPQSKVCELEFLGFDPYSACAKGSPCYGKIPSWTISVDERGSPDPELLRIQ